MLGEQLLLVAVFEGGGAGDTGTEFEYVSVLPFQLVSVTGDIGTWADKAHVADEDVPEFREFIEFVLPEFCAKWCDTALPRYRYRAATVANGHGAELIHCE